MFLFLSGVGLWFSWVRNPDVWQFYRRRLQRILPACRASNVEWYAVERDSGDLPAFDSLKKSLDNLRGKLGC
jgi:peptidoglycan/LPS O-acetylase OafA/YrhL